MYVHALGGANNTGARIRELISFILYELSKETDWNWYSYEALS